MNHPMPREDAHKGRRGRRANGRDSAPSTCAAGTPQAQSVQRLTSAYIQTLDPGADFCVTVSTLKWRETADGPPVQTRRDHSRDISGALVWHGAGARTINESRPHPVGGHPRRLRQPLRKARSQAAGRCAANGPNAQ